MMTGTISTLKSYYLFAVNIKCHIEYVGIILNINQNTTVK